MAAKQSKFQQKLDGFLRVLFFEENGKPKSADLLYSFLLALAAYLWMAVLLIAVMLFALVLIDWSDAKTEYGLFMALIGFPLLSSVVIGGIPALLLHRKKMKEKAAEEKAQSEKAKERPSWYR